jgi:hypothetical protein
MKSRRTREPWPPPELSLPSLDRLEEISRGAQPEPEPPSPHDTQTQARCQLPLWPLPATTNQTEAKR